MCLIARTPSTKIIYILTLPLLFRAVPQSYLRAVSLVSPQTKLDSQLSCCFFSVNSIKGSFRNCVTVFIIHDHSSIDVSAQGNLLVNNRWSGFCAHRWFVCSWDILRQSQRCPSALLADVGEECHSRVTRPVSCHP